MEITAAVLRAADRPSPAPPPIIGGHEGAGVVEAVGEGVSRVRVGDHVALSFDSCGECGPCTHGRPAYCDTFLARNLTGRTSARRRRCRRRR